MSKFNRNVTVLKCAVMIELLMGLFFSCAMFDGTDDISILLEVPDKIIVNNNANVSTLRYIQFEITREDMVVYYFNRNCDIVAGKKDIFKVIDFTIQEGDKAKVKEIRFTWDM
jgi:hypothetical protein